jgi:hypothetical protein
MFGAIRSMATAGIVISAFFVSLLISLLASLFISPFFKKQQITEIKEELTDN